MKITELRSLIKESYKSKSGFMDTSLNNRVIKSGLGFFPYGSGLLIEGCEIIPQKGLMIVGQDFGNISYIKDELINFGEANNPTFSMTVNLLKSYPIEKIFLTNLFMGLRMHINDLQKPKGMMGVNPAFKANETSYLDSSFGFFETQLKVVNPTKIIILGKVPYHFLCSCYEQKKYRVETFEKYRLKNIPGHLLKIKGIPVLCIPHPSMWNSNVNNQQEWRKIILEFIS